MRDLIDLVQNLLEGEVVAFPGNTRPASSLAKAQGGASVHRLHPQWDSLDPFTRHYITTALWSTTDDNGDPLDQHYDYGDINVQTVEAMIADCHRFQSQTQDLLHAAYDEMNYDEDDAGHDFWLTRNRHGAGFWDGDLDEAVGEALTKAAHAFGEFDLYVGDDGAVHGG